MNYSMIRFILGKMLLIEGVLLLLPAIVSLIYQERSGIWFAAVFVLLLATSLVLGRKPKDMAIYAKEGFIVVALAWIFWSAFGALPFVLSGSIPHFVDAFLRPYRGLPLRVLRS